MKSNKLKGIIIYFVIIFILIFGLVSILNFASSSANRAVRAVFARPRRNVPR